MFCNFFSTCVNDDLSFQLFFLTFCLLIIMTFYLLLVFCLNNLLTFFFSRSLHLQGSDPSTGADMGRWVWLQVYLCGRFRWPVQMYRQVMVNSCLKHCIFTKDWNMFKILFWFTWLPFKPCLKLSDGNDEQPLINKLHKYTNVRYINVVNHAHHIYFDVFVTDLKKIYSRKIRLKNEMFSPPPWNCWP